MKKSTFRRYRVAIIFLFALAAVSIYILVSISGKLPQPMDLTIEGPNGVFTVTATGIAEQIIAPILGICTGVSFIIATIRKK